MRPAPRPDHRATTRVAHTDETVVGPCGPGPASRIAPHPPLVRRPLPEGEADALFALPRPQGNHKGCPYGRADCRPGPRRPPPGPRIAPHPPLVRRPLPEGEADVPFAPPRPQGNHKGCPYGRADCRPCPPPGPRIAPHPPLVRRPLPEGEAGAPFATPDHRATARVAPTDERTVVRARGARPPAPGLPLTRRWCGGLSLRERREPGRGVANPPLLQGAAGAHKGRPYTSRGGHSWMECQGVSAAAAPGAVWSLRQAWVEVGDLLDAAEGAALLQRLGGGGELREEVAGDGAAVAQLSKDELAGCAVEERADAGSVEGRHALGEQRRHDARENVAGACRGQRGVGVGDDAEVALRRGDDGEGTLQGRRRGPNAGPPHVRCPTCSPQWLRRGAAGAGTARRGGA